MSDASQVYRLPVNLRIAQNAPPTPGASREEEALYDEVFLALNNLAYSFVTLLGAAPRNFSEWSQLAGSPSTIKADNGSRLYVEASETIAYGDIISLTNVAGALRVRLANATNNTRPAAGFCSTTTGIAIGEVGEVILGHGVLPAAGLTVAQNYFLSTVNGVMANTPAVAAGNIEQYLGIAISPTALYFNSGYWIQH